MKDVDLQRFETRMNIVKFKQDAREKLLGFQRAHKFEGIRLFESDLDTGRTLYLEQDQQILGIASLYHNAFHPKFVNIQFAVDTSNDELVTALYSALLASLSIQSPQLSLHLNESDAKNLAAFLAHHHFSLAIKTEFPQIDLDKSLESLSDAPLPPSYRCLNYGQLNEAEAKELRTFRLQGYEKTHFWSPPLSIDNPFWLESDVETEGQAMSWVVYQDQAIVLCSDAHLEAEDVFLGWGWHNDAYEYHPDLKSLWSFVLRQQLAYCKQAGKRLTGEFDSSDKYGQYKSSLLTHLTQENFYTYHKLQ